jgi:hypothetical protein
LRPRESIGKHGPYVCAGQCRPRNQARYSDIFERCACGA